MNFKSVFVDPRGRTARGPFVLALIVLLLAAALYYFLVGGLTGSWCLVVLIYPAFVLHANRLHDIGQTAWLLLLPVALLIGASWLQIFNAQSALVMPVSVAAGVVSAGFALWGAIGKGKG